MNKRNLTLIISLVVMLVIGIAVMIIGYAVSGADIVAWLGSRYAITIYIFVGVYALIVLALVLRDRIKKL